MMDNLTTRVYTYIGHAVLLEGGENRWALEIHSVDASDQWSDVAIELRHLEHVTALFELGVHVGEMSHANFVSLVELAEAGTLRFHREQEPHTLADRVVSRLHAQRIVEHIL